MQTGWVLEFLCEMGFHQEKIVTKGQIAFWKPGANSNRGMMRRLSGLGIPGF
jgi:hypothetical protein